MDFGKKIIEFYNTTKIGKELQDKITCMRRDRNLTEKMAKEQLKMTGTLTVNGDDALYIASLIEEEMVLLANDKRSEFKKAGFTDEQILIIDKINNMKRTELRLKVSRIQK